jgi:hypothetical protein
MFVIVRWSRNTLYRQSNITRNPPANMRRLCPALWLSRFPIVRSLVLRRSVRGSALSGEDLLSSWATVSFSRRPLLHVVTLTWTQCAVAHPLSVWRVMRVCFVAAFLTTLHLSEGCVVRSRFLPMHRMFHVIGQHYQFQSGQLVRWMSHPITSGYVCAHRTPALPVSSSQNFAKLRTRNIKLHCHFSAPYWETICRLSPNIDLTQTRAEPWLRSLAAGLSPRRSGFAPGSIHVGFVVDKVALGQVFPRVLHFSPVNIIPPSLSKLISSGECVIC